MPEKRENFVEISLAEYEELKAQIPGDEPEAPAAKPWWSAPDDRGWIWIAPEYFSRWRLFPRAFISMYIYLLFKSGNMVYGSTSTYSRTVCFS